MPEHFADRLLRAVRNKEAPVCVGLDPLIERLPTSILMDSGFISSPGDAIPVHVDPSAACEAIRRFGCEVIRTVSAHVPALKINIAFFERYGPEGLATYFDLTKYAGECGLVVIGDVKRADIGHSTTQYAYAHLAGQHAGGAPRPDAVTVNPYFGFDGLRPFVDIARREGRGLFVLVQTSNASAGEMQGVVLSDGSTLCQSVARLVHTWATEEGLVGDSQYSCMGAVVSPRDLASTDALRALMPQCLFLVPGFGAQGRTAAEVAHCFRSDGTGALVTASRSVIYAYRNSSGSRTDEGDWCESVDRACREFVRAVQQVVAS